MSDEVSEFSTTVFSARQKSGKHFEELLRLLREDYPLTAEDKKALADYLEALKTPPKRGRPKTRIFSTTWYLAEAAKKVRHIAKRDGISHKEAIDRVLPSERAQGRQFTFDQILQELNRPQ